MPLDAVGRLDKRLRSTENLCNADVLPMTEELQGPAEALQEHFEEYEGGATLGARWWLLSRFSNEMDARGS